MYYESLISKGDPPDLLLNGQCDSDTDDSDVETDGKQEFVSGVITTQRVGNAKRVSHTVHGRSWKVMRQVDVHHIAQEVGEPGDYMRNLAWQLTSSFCDQYQRLPADDRQGIVRDKNGEVLLIVDHNNDIIVFKDAPRGKGNAREFSVRLATFRRMPQLWQRTNPSAEALARVGFMYLDQEDHVHCFSCGVIISKRIRCVNTSPKALTVTFSERTLQRRFSSLKESTCPKGIMISMQTVLLGSNPLKHGHWAISLPRIS